MRRIMRRTNVYRVQLGWLWEVWIGARLVIIGCSVTREAAELQAKMA
jgi:hypothetical protein